MPPIFKALATIMAWVLWIVALVMGISAFAMGAIHGDLFGTEATPVSYAVFWAVAGFYAVAAVVIMVLRKKME
jgi:vacuolar-type H+-ATPase subunit I/STV1